MANTTNKTNKDPSLLLECYGSKAFVKVYQALNIDRIKFSFAKKGEEQNSIDIYMSAEEFQADLITKIDRKELEKKRIQEINRATTAGDKYCKDIWESRVGKSNKNTIRKFTIQPGQNTEYVFRATESAENGQNPKNILVGFSEKELTLLSFRWSFLYEDYKTVLRERYSMKNMQSTYHQKENALDQDIPYDDAESEQQTATSVPSTDSAPPKDKSDQNQGRRPFSVGSDDTLPNEDTSKGEEPKRDVKRFKLKVKSPIVLLKSRNYAFEGFTQDNIKYAVIIGPQFAGENNWEQFYNICSTAGNMVCFSGIITQTGRIMATAID